MGSNISCFGIMDKVLLFCSKDYYLQYIGINNIRCFGLSKKCGYSVVAKIITTHILAIIIFVVLVYQKSADIK